MYPGRSQTEPAPVSGGDCGYCTSYISEIPPLYFSETTKEPISWESRRRRVGNDVLGVRALREDCLVCFGVLRQLPTCVFRRYPIGSFSQFGHPICVFAITRRVYLRFGQTIRYKLATDHYNNLLDDIGRKTHLTEEDRNFPIRGRVPGGIENLDRV